MASQALYRKWRPQTFDDVTGQGHIIRTLRNALDSGRVAHAYLFTGPRGTGKTTTARLLAKAVNCVGEEDAGRPCNQCHICQAVNEGRLLDLIEIDAASNTGVDDIRDLRDKVSFRPGEARIKFYIIDEVHMLSNSAFNALLKTLEEPPPHVIFVLATTEPEKIPATVLSRCQRFDFRRISVQDVVERLEYIATQEELAVDDTALEFIARQGSGSMRDAISLLDQLSTYGDETVTLERVQAMLGAVASESVFELVDSLVAKDVAGGLSVINEVINDGVEPRQFTDQVIEYLRALLLVKVGHGPHLLNLPEETLARMRAQATQVESPRLIQAARVFSDAVRDIKQGVASIPQLPLELAFVEVVSDPQPVSPQSADVAHLAEIAPRGDAAHQHSSPPAATETKPTPPSSQPGSSPASEFSLPGVEAQWHQILGAIRAKDKMAYGLFNSGKPIAIRGNVVEVSFQSDLLKKRAEQEKNRRLAEETLQTMFGREVVLQFVVGERSHPLAGQDAGAPASSRDNEVAEGASVEDDPLVKAGLELGGQIAGTKPL